MPNFFSHHWSLDRRERWEDLCEVAWGIIANAGEGDWGKESRVWQDAAIRWRESYFAALAHDREQSGDNR